MVMLWMMVLALANRERRLRKEFESLCDDVNQLREELIAVRQSADFFTPTPDFRDVIRTRSSDWDRLTKASPP